MLDNNTNERTELPPLVWELRGTDATLAPRVGGCSFGGGGGGISTLEDDDDRKGLLRRDFQLDRLVAGGKFFFLCVCVKSVGQFVGGEKWGSGIIGRMSLFSFYF